MLETPRRGLLHDWEQGNYIQNGVYDGRIDWDVVSELEAESRRLIEYWYYEEEKDLCIWWSGGVDVAVVFHMVWEMGLADEIPAVTFRTPEHYQSSVDYVTGMAERLGFDLENVVDDSQDIEWVAADPETRLFPSKSVKNDFYRREYRRPAAKHQRENGYDLGLTGLRTEHGGGVGNREFVWRNNGSNGGLNGNPILKWHISHVLAYLDKYDMPIPEAYHILTTGANHPWHRELTSAAGHERTRSESECWYLVREATVRHGYTDFWKRILDYFPEGEAEAGEWAAGADESLLSLDAGYEHGADTYSVPYPCGPNT